MSSQRSASTIMHALSIGTSGLDLGAPRGSGDREDLLFDFDFELRGVAAWLTVFRSMPVVNLGRHWYWIYWVSR
jgi:hypothetical protein